jgi:hypothetical protein
MGRRPAPVPRGGIQRPYVALLPVPPVAPGWLPKQDKWQNSVRRFLFWLPEPTVATERRIASEACLARRSAIDLALEFQRLLDDGVVNTRADLARRFGMSRARVTQVMNVLRLARPAQNLLRDLAPCDPSWWTERRLRPVLLLPTEAEQLAAIRWMEPRADSAPGRGRR